MGVAKTIAALLVTLALDASGFMNGVQRATDQAEKLRRGVQPVAEQSERTARSVGTLEKAVLGFATGQGLNLLYRGLESVVVAAAQWEDAFAGVRKTVDATERQYGQLAAGLRQLSLELPVTAVELARVAENAGQLGVKRENIIAFTETMAKLGMTTNLTAEEGATLFAQFGNIVGMAQEKTGALASVLVALGNAGASTEADIMRMALRLAAAGDLVGLTEPKILALSASLADVGLSAELGGFNFSKFITEMNTAVISGGGQLQQFAKVAGVSATQFATSFRQDAAGAVIAFLEGLNRVKSSGGDVVKTLEQAGLTGGEIAGVLLRAAGNADGLKQSFALANEEMVRNNALTEEAAKRTETAVSQWQIFKNSVTDLAVAIGEKLNPALEVALRVATAMVQAATNYVRNPQTMLPNNLQVPMASGGLVRSPQLTLIGEGSYSTRWGTGAEAVVPLHGNPYQNLARILGGDILAMAGGGIIGGGAQYAAQVGRRGVTTGPAQWDQGFGLLQALLASILQNVLASAGGMSSLLPPREFVGPPSPSLLASALSAFGGASASNGLDPFTGRALRPGQASAALTSAGDELLQFTDSLESATATAKTLSEQYYTSAQIEARRSELEEAGFGRFSDSLDSVTTLIDGWNMNMAEAQMLETAVTDELTGLEAALAEAAPAVTRTEMAFQTASIMTEQLSSRIQPLLGSIQITDDAISALAPHVDGAAASFALMQQGILQATGVVYGLAQIGAMRERQQMELTLLASLDALAQGTTLAAQLQAEYSSSLLSAVEPPALLSDVMQRATAATEGYTESLMDGTSAVQAGLSTLAAGFGGAGTGLIGLGAGFRAVGAGAAADAAEQAAEEASATEEFLRNLYGTGPGSKFGSVQARGSGQSDSVSPAARWGGGGMRPIIVQVDGRTLFEIEQAESYSQGRGNLNRM